MPDEPQQAGSWTDLDISVDVPHSLGAKDAAMRLQSLEGLTMQRCTVELAGQVLGHDVSASLTIASGNIAMRLTGTKPFIVPQKSIENYVTNLLRKALQ